MNQTRQKPTLGLRRILLILISIILLIAIVAGVVGFIFSNTLLIPNHQVSFTLEATNVSTNSVTLPLTHETEQVGTFGLTWAGGQAAIVGNITHKNQTTVTRQLLQTTIPLADHTMVSMNRELFDGTLRNTLGLTINTVQVSDPLGQLPAFYVPGKSDTWAILIHGLNDSLNTGLRFFSPLANLGLPILETSYRNDVGAPPSPDGLLHLGDSEWHDVDAAVKYAMDHGAHHLVIYGWSMGGATAEEFMHHSVYASSVQAIILDAPVLDWRTTLNFQAAKRNLPNIVADDAEFVSTLRTGINFDNFDQLDQAQSQTPILLFHGTGDTTTPIAVSDAFAKKHADIVTYDRVAGADHVQSWNTDPQKYDDLVSTFLKRILHLQ
jgi:pimeloyl-ACP methyl ester carboxylesterase